MIARAPGRRLRRNSQLRLPPHQASVRRRTELILEGQWTQLDFRPTLQQLRLRSSPFPQSVRFHPSHPHSRKSLMVWAQLYWPQLCWAHPPAPWPRVPAPPPSSTQTQPAESHVRLAAPSTALATSSLRTPHKVTAPQRPENRTPGTAAGSATPAEHGSGPHRLPSRHRRDSPQPTKITMISCLEHPSWPEQAEPAKKK